MNFRATRILAAVLLATSCGLAFGASTTTSFNVTAQVAANCTVTNSGPINFGAYVPGTTPTGSTVISVVCTNGTLYSIGLSAGSGGGTAASMRTMASLGTPADTLEFNLFTDNTYSTFWGDVTGGAYNAANTNWVSGTGAGMLAAAAQHPVYARLPDSANNQIAKPHADYSSTIIATVWY